MRDSMRERQRERKREGENKARKRGRWHIRVKHGSKHGQMHPNYRVYCFHGSHNPGFQNANAQRPRHPLEDEDEEDDRPGQSDQCPESEVGNGTRTAGQTNPGDPIPAILKRALNFLDRRSPQKTRIASQGEVGRAGKGMGGLARGSLGLRAHPRI